MKTSKSRENNNKFWKTHSKKNKSKISSTDISERNYSLTSLGFYSYSDYLKSDLWKKIRKSVIDNNEGFCKFCHEKAKYVHHSSYDLDTMKGLNLRHLHPVCRSCHEQGHKKGCASVPDSHKGKCPRCRKKRMNPTDQRINLWSSNIKDKVVCDICKNVLINSYNSDNEKQIQQYSDLPCGYKWHFNKGL